MAKYKYHNFVPLSIDNPLRFDKERTCRKLDISEKLMIVQTLMEMGYVDEEGNKKYPYLLHASISGGIDRCVCALLENEAKKMKKGIKPMLPFWLSPTQVRLIPVKKEYVNECIELSEKINARVDIDDRDESVARRIRDAEKEWVPIIIVYGEKEREGKITPRCRFDCGEIKTIEELNNKIDELAAGFPTRKLPLPKLLSMRARFK